MSKIKLLTMIAMISIASVGLSLDKPEFDYEECAQKFEKIKWTTPEKLSDKAKQRYESGGITRKAEVLWKANLPHYEKHIKETIGSDKYWSEIGQCAGLQALSKGKTLGEKLAGIGIIAFYATIDAYTYGQGSSIMEMLINKDQQPGPNQFDILFDRLSSQIDKRLFDERKVDFGHVWENSIDELVFFKNIQAPDRTCIFNQSFDPSCSFYLNRMVETAEEVRNTLNNVVFGVGTNMEHLLDGSLYTDIEFEKERWKYAPFFFYLMNELTLLEDSLKSRALLSPSHVTVKEKYLLRLGSMIHSFYAYHYEHGEQYPYNYRDWDEEFEIAFGVSRFQLDKLLRGWAEVLGLNQEDFRVCKFTPSSRPMAAGSFFVYDPEADDWVKSVEEFTGGTTCPRFQYIQGKENFLYYSWLVHEMYEKWGLQLPDGEVLETITNASNDIEGIKRALQRYELQRVLGEVEFTVSTTLYFAWLDDLTDGRKTPNDILREAKEMKRKQQIATTIVIVNSLIL